MNRCGHEKLTFGCDTCFEFAYDVDELWKCPRCGLKNSWNNFVCFGKGNKKRLKKYVNVEICGYDRRFPDSEYDRY